MTLQEDQLNDDYIETDEDSQKDKYLTFRVDDEDFAVDIRYVIEIIGIQKITGLPDMPDFIKGVINLRGKVIPVMDIRLRFHMKEIEYGDRTCIIVAKVGETYFGLIVDTVSEVLDIPASEIDPPPRSGMTGSRRYLQGIGKVGDQVKIILDINRILSEEELSDIKQIES
ncbi:MAG: chemotaxis protein CheW [Candidatus Kapaibacterium sp.]